MNTSTKFDWHYVSPKKLRAACKQTMGDEEMTLLGELDSGESDGAMLLIPVLSDGSRDQSLHCLLRTWGKTKTHTTLDEAVRFVGDNFPNCRFYVLLCDGNKMTCPPQPDSK